MVAPDRICHVDGLPCDCVEHEDICPQDNGQEEQDYSDDGFESEIDEEYDAQNENYRTLYCS